MGGIGSGRYSWLEHVPKVTREESFSLGVEQAIEQGIETTRVRRGACGYQTRIVCPQCGARCAYLYRPPIVKPHTRFHRRESLPHAEEWKCAKCYDLAFKSSRQSGTVAAMREARARDYAEFVKLPDDCGLDFSEFQKLKHRSYNRRKWKKAQFGKIPEN